MRNMYYNDVHSVSKFQVVILSKTPRINRKTLKKRRFFGHFFHRCPVFGQLCPTRCPDRFEIQIVALLDKFRVDPYIIPLYNTISLVGVRVQTDRQTNRRCYSINIYNQRFARRLIPFGDLHTWSFHTFHCCYFTHSVVVLSTA